MSQLLLALLTPLFLILGLNSPSYDYEPTIVKEGLSEKAWWCGLNPSLHGDAIYYSEAPDGRNWSLPKIVMTPTQSWEGIYVCAPSIIVSPTGPYRYTMYYEGATSSQTNSIGVAWSHDGVAWVKYRANPVIDCRAATGYGCGQPAIVRLPTKLVLTHTSTTNGTTGMRIEESVDGLHFSNPQPLCLSGGCGAMPGLDVMYDPTGRYPWLLTYTANRAEVLYGAAQLGGPMTLLGTGTTPGFLPGDARTGSYGSGFVRGDNGWKPSGNIKTYFGYPGDPHLTARIQSLDGFDWPYTN